MTLPTETKLGIHRFWGKARPLRPDHGPRWHPLVFHCLDVAAVGQSLLARHHWLGDHLSRLIGLDRKDTARLAVFLLCLHDIGKFAKKFQAKVPDLYPVCFDDDLARLSGFYDHGAGGLRLFDAEDGFFKLPNGRSRFVSGALRAVRNRPVGFVLVTDKFGDALIPVTFYRTDKIGR